MSSSQPRASRMAHPYMPFPKGFPASPNTVSRLRSTATTIQNDLQSETIVWSVTRIGRYIPEHMMH